jgi:type II restriction enzyme
VASIAQLPRNRQYSYINPATRTKIIIESVEAPEGPIRIKRYDPTKGETPLGAESQTISREMIWRIANSIRLGVPVNFDRVLGASYNTRSAFEALLAHTPQFYWCKPGRIEVINSSTAVKRGHKHLIWLPEQPHENGVISEYETETVISEIPSQEVVYDSLFVPYEAGAELDIEVRRRHIQIQIALIMIGNHLNFSTWLAQNDRGVMYQDKTLAEIDGVLPRLNQDTVIAAWGEAVNAAKLIDIIWFKGVLEMPAVIEVEHSTGVTSGLSRMQNFQSKLPPFPTRYIIAAPDEDRTKVLREIHKEQFDSLQASYLPYSAIEQVWNLFSKHGAKGVSPEFIENFLER